MMVVLVVMVRVIRKRSRKKPVIWRELNPDLRNLRPHHS